jgi:hypothetical protein
VLVAPIVLLTAWAPAGMAAAADVQPVGAADATADCTRYVEHGGDDAALGTIAAPWATLQHGVDVAQPGEVICVRSGIYARSAEMDIFRSGSAEAPVEVVAIEPDVVVASAINLRPGASHLRIRGLQIRGSEQWGVALWGDNADVVLSDLDISGTEVGVRLTVGEPDGEAALGPVCDVTIERTVVDSSEIAGVACVPGPCAGLVLHHVEVMASGGTGIEVNGADVTIERSWVSDSRGDGVVVRHREPDIDRDPGQPQLRQQAGQGTARLVDSRVERSRGVGVRLVGGGEVVNSVIVDSGASSVVTSAGPAALINSTVAACLQARSLVEIVGDAAGPGTSAQIVNTILFNDSPTMAGRLLTASAGVQLQLVGNLFYNPFGEAEVLCQSDGRGTSCVGSDGVDDLGLEDRPANRWADPRFFAAHLGDFHLTDASPAVDSGMTEAAPPADIEGVQRDAASDIGAYEHRAGSCLLACSAVAPSRVAVSEAFELKALVRSSGCEAEPDLRWDVGHAAEAVTTRVVRTSIAEAGQVEWSLSASVGDRVCRTAGIVEAVPTRSGKVERVQSDQAARATAAGGPARQTSISWWTVDGGGGTSTGGVYTLSGTIGQPDASAAMTGGAYTLTGGFWAGMGPRVCDVDRSGTCDAQDLAWIVWCADDSGCGSPGDPDVNGDAVVDGGDSEVVISGVY